ncbi:MAG: type II toxin-antitoxin system Phd/YefM family antitoxin [Candidatus Kerfeldbacteria bacterium]|nr:type II toxin-antitoxin system Phd/YefM family antitoxin [Candidatus Kerfeldbacteria bacterium]
MNRITKRVFTASEAKRRFGAVIDAADQKNTEVIVESHGRPKVVIVSFNTYAALLSLAEQSQREESLHRLRSIRKEVQKKSPHLSHYKIKSIIDEVSRETIRRLIQSNRIRYEAS